MPLEEEGLTEKAAVWELSHFNAHGNPVVLAAVEIDSRWEIRRRSSINDIGEAIATHAEVMVDRELKLNSLIRRGELADVPSPPDNLYEVIDYWEVPDVKGEEIQRNVTLKRWKKAAPTIA